MYPGTENNEKKKQVKDSNLKWKGAYFSIFKPFIVVSLSFFIIPILFVIFFYFDVNEENI